MVFSKSIALVEDDIAKVAAATGAAPVADLTSSDFIERLRSGDAEAFDTLITRYSGEVFSLLRRITDDVDEAADLTQETFLSALKSIRSFRGEAELKTWLYRIAVNHSHNRFRWWKRRKRDETISLDRPISEGSTTRLSETIADAGESPEDAAIRSERMERLRTALRSLPAIFRETVVLCDIEGFGYEEAAQVLSINIGTVKSRLARGREQLRKKLAGF